MNIRTPTLCAMSLLCIASCSGSGWDTSVDTAHNIRFEHPSEWGQWVIDDIPSYPDSDVHSEMHFSNVPTLLSEQAEIYAVFRQYDDQKYRYEEVCDMEKSTELCNVTKMQDILQEKEEFERNADDSISGIPAVVRDFYDVPSGYVAREARFFTSEHRVRLVAIYYIGTFLASKDSSADSLQTVAQRLLGNDLGDPIHKLTEKYPNELKEMKLFFEDVDAYLESIVVQK